ncbi:MAG: transposase [Desulfobacterales bacterium]|nr:transposase [Desulfobacterales bacterium]MDD3082752.1 transposase [Desulfobacterales bacterium]MDD3951541.1 transposase [Desulfobacterales bacterium]MDD4463418.1 transposase [Desulfobacterales bacterium]
MRQALPASVSGRGSLWTDERPGQMLGTAAYSTDGAIGSGSGVPVFLRGNRSAGRHIVHWMVADTMKTEHMSRFLGQIGVAHPDRHVVMVLDDASSHKAKALEAPDNVSLILLPAYSPELNPVEIIAGKTQFQLCV